MVLGSSLTPMFTLYPKQWGDPIRRCPYAPNVNIVLLHIGHIYAYLLVRINAYLNRSAMHNMKISVARGVIDNAPFACSRAIQCNTRRM